MQKSLDKGGAYVDSLHKAAEETMDNLVLLKKQFLKPVKITLIIVDFLWALYFAFLLVSGIFEEPEALFPLGGPLIVLILLNVLLLEARKPEPYLKSLPPDVVKTINEECMTGLRCGNGILCESDCLLIVGVIVRAFFPQNIKTITSLGMQGGLISVVDLSGKQYTVGAKKRTVYGKGTFQEVDFETFLEKLCNVQSSRIYKI